mmetsp:Transcript_54503/g.145421  ORF Transcript_54503/g.145421 Transcript_54503/m.145421 type:complete len:304 (+) Transcript_54503:354-1265(+)
MKMSSAPARQERVRDVKKTKKRHTSLTSLHVCCHSGSCFGAHGTPLLRCCGMDAHRGIEVRLGRARFHGYRQSLHHLASICSDHVCANHPSRAFEPLAHHQQLHQNSLLITSTSGHGVLHRLELGEEDVDTAILFRRLGLRQTARPDGRLAEDSTGHVLVIGFGRNTEHRGCHGHSLHQSHWGQIDPVGDITDGEDRIDVGSAVLVDQDLPRLRVKSHTRRLQAQVCGIGFAPRGKHYVVRQNLGPRVRFEQQLSIACLGNACRALANVRVDPLSAEQLAQVISDIFIEAPQGPVSPMDQMHL